MNLEKIPATVVTGFLGSGKTTLLANMIKQAAGKRIAVIVNEFGELDIDADLLRNCPLDCPEDGVAELSGAISKGGIYELANGCICCTVEEEFLPVMRELVARRADIDHILIETSGLALPKPLVQAFNWPEIQQHCTVDSVITVVDGAAMAAGRIAHAPAAVQAQRVADVNLDHDASLQELLDDQLASADLVLISKADLITEQQQQDLTAALRKQLKPAVQLLPVSHGVIANECLMGLNFAAEAQIEAVHTHHDKHHHHNADHRHAHEAFNALSIKLGVVDGARLLAILQEQMAEQTIYRIKGFLALEGKPMRQVLQGVGARFTQYFDRPWAEEIPHSKVVLIGKDLDLAALQTALKAAEVAPR